MDRRPPAVLWSASLQLAEDPDSVATVTLSVSGRPSKDAAVAALAEALHQRVFMKEISANDEENLNDYATPLGFIESIKREHDSEERPDSYSAAMIWDALYDAVCTINVKEEEARASDGGAEMEPAKKRARTATEGAEMDGTLQAPAAAAAATSKIAAAASAPSWAASANGAAARLRQVRDSGGCLLVLTGAGMSVSSGVPVFRGDDGSMSADFLRFLDAYNAARRRNGLEEAEDWFEFSVPEMFNKETEAEAWAYWRWRILRAVVTPAEDYQQLMRLIAYFGPERCFVETSNCDQLHAKAAAGPSSDDRLHEIHGSLGYLHCANLCCETLHPNDDAFRKRLREDPAWVPRCPACKQSCLRPNVLIFQDDMFVDARRRRQSKQKDAFNQRVERTGGNLAVLEVGAGLVIPSIRSAAEWHAEQGQVLVRINPSKKACEEMETDVKLDGLAAAGGGGGRYFPVVARGSEALQTILAKLLR